MLICWWLEYTGTFGLSMREVDGLVYTEEEVKLDRLEKHIFVWKVDLERSVGENNLHLEGLLAERLSMGYKCGLSIATANECCHWLQTSVVNSNC